jgi:hypothetical protein
MTEDTQQDTSSWTGDRNRYAEMQRAFDASLAELQRAEDRSARAVALAIRAGLAEIAVEISSVRGFGIGQAQKRG